MVHILNVSILFQTSLGRSNHSLDTVSMDGWITGLRQILEDLVSTQCDRETFPMHSRVIAMAEEVGRFLF
jgi:hypothetical protein